MRMLVALTIALSVFDGIFAQAPGDADPFCNETLPRIGFNILDYAPEVKPLMDSRHYRNLLPPHADAVWQEVDNDNNNPSHLTTDWLQNTNTVCRQTAFVCGFQAGNQDNWMITQHISRMVGGTALPQVTVQVDFQLNSCMEVNNCGRTFSIHKYETSTINATAARNLSNYEFVPPRISPGDDSGDARENMSIQVDFSTTATGFYLGIQDETSCVLVHRVLVFYYVCPAVTSDLITRPERIAPFIGNSPPILVNGQCVENSSPQNGMWPRLTCSKNGVWGGIDGAGCVCDTGFQRSLDGHSCIGCDAGMYLSVNLTCLPCPDNSNSTQQGLSECPCFERYFRVGGEPPGKECTQPPSVPRNLTVLQVTNTSVQLSWDPPVSNGGRDDLEYQLSYQRAGVPENVTVYGRVNVTVGQITGLRPSTQYVVMVSGENGVSAQAPDASGRTVRVTITTEEGVTCLPVVTCPSVVECPSLPCPPLLPATPPPPPAQVICVSVFYDENKRAKVVVWGKPVGEVTVYSVRISYNDGSSGQLISKYSSSRNQWLEQRLTDLPAQRPLWIEVRACNSGGAAPWSSRVELCADEEEDSESPAPVIVAAVIPSIVAVIAITLFGVVLCSYIRLRMKLDERQNSVAARDYPEYATAEPNPASRQTIETKQIIAHETGIAISTESNAAYRHVSMQGHSPEPHDTSF